VSADLRLALSFGRVAELYDRVRPDYSQQSLDRAQEALELEATAHVLDLAAGTGRLTQELARRFEHVVAVEQDGAMRSRITDGEVLAGTAESIPLRDASVDAVFVGEAFHWFDATRAVPEVARVLRPRGGVALFSNLWWETEPPLPQAARDLLNIPFVASGRADAVETWRDVFAESVFEPLRDETFAAEKIVDAETLLAMYQTTSSIAALPEDERRELAARVRPLLSSTYRLPIRVELTWTRLAR
jgi:ubiquinone/menaquinone biosynthesis C-methylase UbiE